MAITEPIPDYKRLDRTQEFDTVKDGVQYLTATPTSRHPSSVRFHNILHELGELHDRKQADYGTDQDPFNNVRASSREWNIPSWVAALLRGGDKMRRLQAFATKGSLANESAYDSLKDLAVYAIIAHVLMEEDASEEEHQHQGQLQV